MRSRFQNIPSLTDESSPTQWSYYLPRMTAHSATGRVVCQELYWRELLIGKCGCIAQTENSTWTSRDFTQNKLNSSAIIAGETGPRSLCASPAPVPTGEVWVQAGAALAFSGRAWACLTLMAFIVPVKDCCQVVSHSSFDSIIYSLPRRLFYDHLAIAATTGLVVVC